MNLTFRLISNQKKCNGPEVTQCLLQKYTVARLKQKRNATTTAWSTYYQLVNLSANSVKSIVFGRITLFLIEKYAEVHKTHSTL